MRKKLTDLRHLRLLAILAFAAAGSVGRVDQAFALISYNGGAYSQNFDSLTQSTTSVAWANDSTLLGWSLYRQPAPGTAITAYVGGDGSSNGGSFYSFGVAGTNPIGDRALGGLGSGGAYFGSPGPLSGAVAGWFAVGITNTDSTFNSFTVSFDGEQWRDGAFSPSGSTPQTMVLEYGFGSDFTTVPTWIAPGGTFDFTSPTVGATVATALDGNLSTNRVANLGGTISALNWTNGQTLWIRWIERNDVGNDHALAVDNFSFHAAAVPEPSSCLLAALGSIGVGVVLRRRRRK